DRWNSHGSVEEIGRRNQILDEHCATIGRDPKSILRSLYGWSTLLPVDPWQSVDAFDQVIGSYREVGINDFIIDAPRDDQLGVLERVAADALPRLRGSDSSS